MVMVCYRGRCCGGDGGVDEGGWSWAVFEVRHTLIMSKFITVQLEDVILEHMDHRLRTVKVSGRSVLAWIIENRVKTSPAVQLETHSALHMNKIII